MASGISQGLFFNIVTEFFNYHIVIYAYGDSRAACSIARRSGGEKMKHLDMRVPWVQEMKASGLVKLRAVNTNEKKADLGVAASQDDRETTRH